MNKRFKYEKGIFFLSFIVFMVCSCLFTSCASVGRTGGDIHRDTDIIVRNQVAYTELENTVNRLDELVDESRSEIGEIVRRSQEITTTIDRLEYLFGCYESEINRILSGIIDIKTAITEKRDGNTKREDERPGTETKEPER